MMKILVVDDIDTNRKMIVKMLSLLEIGSSIEAVNGEDAILKFKAEQPDLILMDVSMPVMDGFQAATAIKKLCGDNYVPIIFVTALSSESSLGYALASGGDDYITKPVNVEVLESKVKVHLRIRKLNQQLDDRNKQLCHEQELIEHFFESAVKKSYLDKKFIRYHMSSMSTFNGDLLLVERCPKGGIYVLMGDFTGHGLTAAMGTLPVAMIFFRMVHKGMSVNDMAAELNYQLNELMPVGMFFATTIIEINARSDMMSVWMGGVPEMYLLNRFGDLKSAIQSKHMPLGILKQNEFEPEAELYNIEEGDKLYLYSDGVTEAKNTDDKMFGSKRLKKVLTQSEGDRFENVINELKTFVSTGTQTDDVSLVEVTCSKFSAYKKIDFIENKNIASIPWQASIYLSCDEIQNSDPVVKLADSLAAMPGLINHKSSLNLLLSEMYSNSLEHSILELDSSKKINEEQFSEYYDEREKKLAQLKDGFIEFNFTCLFDDVGSKLQIEIFDSGVGYVKKVQATDNDLYGHGMKIMESLCEECSFSADGKKMCAIYRL
ncbi:Serine phosphatase RsbU, regulator of sigma subunit [hydrothermal vent metagenome]|uniref:Serine phosphatase RsbU, regulator of sigma subunit n=1 Tax=hydrothermal vent metagenome TaxID=652676 RepID=A0A3B0XSQ8_9ZZZZ